MKRNILCPALPFSKFASHLYLNIYHRTQVEHCYCYMLVAHNAGKHSCSKTEHVTSLDIAHTFASCHCKYSQIFSVLCFDRKGLRCQGL